MSHLIDTELVWGYRKRELEEGQCEERLRRQNAKEKSSI